MDTLIGIKVWELIDFLKDQEPNALVLIYTYDSRSGDVKYRYPCFGCESISRTDENKPIECLEGDGGNEDAIIISMFDRGVTP